MNSFPKAAMAATWSTNIGLGSIGFRLGFLQLLFANRFEFSIL
jgi:hypothetical protein